MAEQQQALPNEAPDHAVTMVARLLASWSPGPVDRLSEQWHQRLEDQARLTVQRLWAEAFHAGAVHVRKVMSFPTRMTFTIDTPPPVAAPPLPAIPADDDEELPSPRPGDTGGPRYFFHCPLDGCRWRHERIRPELADPQPQDFPDGVPVGDFSARLTAAIYAGIRLAAGADDAECRRHLAEHPVDDFLESLIRARTELARASAVSA